MTTANCPNCAFRLSSKDRVRARFGAIECPQCGVRLRANVRTALVTFYTVLTVLMFLGFLWSTRAGCLLPLVSFFLLWIAGEVLAGLVSPLERTDQESS